MRRELAALLHALLAAATRAESICTAVPGACNGTFTGTVIRPCSTPISGTLPTQLGSLTQLQTLVLDCTTNTISGTVPSEFGGFTQMQLLNLNSN